MDISLLLQHLDSLPHQLFIIVMGLLYGFAHLIGVSYQAMNIYSYFVFFPVSLLFFIRMRWYLKVLLFVCTLLFFLIPGFENFSQHFFDLCVVFLHNVAAMIGSDYVRVSIYLCVILPGLIYLGAYLLRYGKKKTLFLLEVMLLLFFGYCISFYLLFEPIVLYLMKVIKIEG